jgi:predicted AAA+ superfamily ATPase
MNDIEIVKDLIIKESGIDITEKRRHRNVIELRSLFFNVARKVTPISSYSAIGKSVGVDHATVLHSLKMFDVYSKYNKGLNELKDNVIKRFKIENKFYGVKTIDEEIQRLELRIAELNELKEFLKKDENNLVV